MPLIRRAAQPTNGKLPRKIRRDGGFGISTQVLQEFYVTATKKLKRPLSLSTAARWVDQLCKAELISLDASIIKLGIAYSSRYQVSCWDGAIIAAAEALGAATVYSEYMTTARLTGRSRS